MPIHASLFLVGEYHLFRECLASMLSRAGRFAVVDQTSTLEELCERLGDPPSGDALPDAVLYDVGARHQGDVEDGIRELTEELPELKIIALGLEEDEEEILKFIEAGASAYVLKEVSVNELVSVIDQVLRGEAPCSPKITSTMFSRLADLARARRREEQLEALCLTPREIEILQYVADGLSNKEIAERLYLSFHTVKNHIHNILEKLQVRHRGQAVEYAYRKRWLKARGDGTEPRLI